MDNKKDQSEHAPPVRWQSADTHVYHLVSEDLKDGNREQFGLCEEILKCKKIRHSHKGSEREHIYENNSMRMAEKNQNASALCS